MTQKKTDVDISAKDKNVIVLGGGDTGSDCIGTSNMLGQNQYYNLNFYLDHRWRETIQ